MLSIGDSITLTPADLDDAEQFLNLAATNAARLRQVLGSWVLPSTVEDRRKLMASDLQAAESSGRHWWMIEHDGRFAGSIDIHGIKSHERSGSIGYWLGADFTGLGIMTQSLKAVIDWALTERSLVRIEIQIAIENADSCAVPERLGIRRESINRQSHIVEGQAHDMALYAALTDNWPPKPPSRAFPHKEIRVDNEILLRQHIDGDRAKMWKALDAGRDYIGKYLPWMAAYITEADHTSGYDTRRNETDNFDGSRGYIIEYKGALAGTAGFGKPDSDNGGEIGYWIRQDLQGRGIATRVVEKIIDMMIIEMGLHRITIRAATSNMSSPRYPRAARLSLRRNDA